MNNRKPNRKINNLDAAKKFLDKLAPTNTQFTFQTFDDNKTRNDPSLTKILHGTLDQHAQALHDLNKKGAAVCVMANEGDLKGRAAKNVQRVRAVFADLDGAPLEPVAECTLRPHMIVETSRDRFHAYWLVQDLPVDKFAAVQASIALTFDSDTAVTDVSRVMRLPGFKHRKGRQFTTKIAETIDSKAYSAQEILDEFQPLWQDDLRKLTDATGKSGRGGKQQERAIIKIIGGEISATIDRAQEALLKHPEIEIYQHGGRLVEIIDRPVTSASDGGSTSAPTIQEISTKRLAEILTNAAMWIKKTGQRQRFTVVDCPDNIARTYQERQQWRVPVLTAVIEAPTIREDGTILDRPGYDKSTCLFFRPGTCKFPTVPARPSKNEAMEALGLLKEVLRDFPFVDGAARSVMLSAILTAMVRRSLPSAPLFCITAHQMGSGKSLLADVVSMIATGQRAAVMSQAGSREEEKKRLLPILSRGHSIVVIDNIEDPIASDTLCSILTQPTYEDRVLGQSKIETVPTTALFLATGNNLQVHGDMISRVVVCTIDPGCERPEGRKFDVNLHKEIPARRGELVTAGLTILRAYHEAGRPDQEIEQFGRFEDWSDWVRSALIWLGEADPNDTRSLVEGDDPSTRLLKAVLPAWHTLFSDKPKSVSSAVNAIKEPNRDTNKTILRDAFLEISEDDRGEISNMKVGRWFNRLKGRPTGGLKIEQASGKIAGSALWKVIKT